jgi:hypothetical protein
MNIFDSNEEMYMFWWFEELQKNGYIETIEAQPKSFNLLTGLRQDYKTKYKRKEGHKMTEETILNGHIYTTDFYVEWTEKAMGIFTVDLLGFERKKKGQAFEYILAQKNLLTDSYYSYIEVKPVFDQNNMTRLAKINQKWVWQKSKQYINIVIPEKHFNKTFTPIRFLTTNKSKQTRKIKYKNVLTLKDFIQKKLSLLHT